MKRRTFAATAGALVAVLAFAGCTGAAPEPTPPPVAEPTPDASPEPDVTPEPDPEPAPIVYPLTGVPVDEVPQIPALAVKIENTAAARPQIGLEFADLVWETVVEGGITRFVAFYHSNLPDEVGPVRSVRPQDAAIVAPFNGVFAYSGGQPAFLAMIDEVNVQSVTQDRGSPGFSRLASRRAPHNLLLNVQNAIGQANASRTVPPPNAFDWAREVGAGSAVTDGRPVEQIVINMSRGQRTVWDWDATSGTFLRSDGNQASVSDTGVRHSAQNVVLIESATRTSAADGNVPETFLVGSGRAVVATGGRVIEGTWSQPGPHDMLVLTLANGDRLTLDPGQTWVHSVPETSGSWELN